MSQHEGREKLDAAGEFFSVGAPLHAVRAGYIKRRADDLLFETVAAGRYAHVIAPDRSGKSSLIAAISARLENNGSKVAILDLAQIGVRDGGTDAGRWYYSVAYRLLRQLRIRFDLQDWWQDKSFLSNRQRLVEFYSEVVLPNVSERIIVFVDEIQCIEDLPYADQLLASIRAAHNARMTDPEFSRLSFVLSGECDPVSLVEEAELSPFNITQQVPLDDFSRDDLNLFATELNLDPANAAIALDRIFYWTSGQPYLSQKLARAISRETVDGNIEDQVDHIALHQLAGRAALHNEPHMSHIHRRLVRDSRDPEALLNLYGKLRKGIEVPADLGSPEQRRLMAVGLVVIDADGNLAVRNRLYGAVFTTRWANENLPTRLRVPLMVAAGILLFVLVPFWYTQWLPGPYVSVLADDTTELDIAAQAYENFASFPGHSETALSLYRSYLERRAQTTTNVDEISELSTRLANLPGSGRLPAEVEAGFWDRRMLTALRAEDRDAALVANLRSLIGSTNTRRQRAATLVGDDYPDLLTTLPPLPDGQSVFDSENIVLTSASGATISQWAWSGQSLLQREPWSITALEVTPLVRRVIVDREGTVNRIGMTLNISHARMSDLRVRVIAPSGRAVEIDPGVEHASTGDDIRIPASQLRDLAGESLSGTWSISVRDEVLGVAGQLVGWNLTLNAQGAVEYFQRGLNISDPVERETDNLWFDPSGRYAVARATQSDSARIWDLSFSQPVRAVAVSASETLIGVDTSASRMVTATQDSVNVWDTVSGDRVATLAIGAASASAQLTSDGTRLFVIDRGDVESRLQLWSLETAAIEAEITVAGFPADVSLDDASARVAIADFDRAVRVWDFANGELLAQLDLAQQPSDIQLSADGRALGALYAMSGASLWNIANPQQPLLEESGEGDWRIAFSPSGQVAAVGHPVTGFQVYSTADGRLVGPPVGMRDAAKGPDLLAFSSDEQLLLTGSAQDAPRLWRASSPAVAGETGVNLSHTIWSPSADRPLLATPGGEFIVIGDQQGHVHVIPSGAGLTDVADEATDVSYIGHGSAITGLAVDARATHVASVASDNTVRAWDVGSGAPLPWTTTIDADPVDGMKFSPSGEIIAVRAGSAITLIGVRDGSRLAVLNVGQPIGDLSFATDGPLYVGTRDGALHVVQQQVDGGWQTQQIWQGETGIRALEVSPRGDVLILVDTGNLASQFILGEGRVADVNLQLPSEVHEVTFDAAGARAYFRTARWVHRATASVSGLHWNDAVLAPRALPGARLVFRLVGSSLQPVLPAARNNYVELVDVSGAEAAGLFGSRDDLLDEWLGRLSADLPAASGPEVQDSPP